MRIPASKLNLHNNPNGAPPSKDLHISYLSFTTCNPYFHLVFDKWKISILPLLSIHFQNDNSRSMFLAWVEQNKIPKSFDAFWNHLLSFVYTFEKFLKARDTRTFFSYLKQFWSLVSIQTWVNLTPKDILMCNSRSIFETQRKLWVIIEQHQETGHYLINKESMGILLEINSEYKVDLVIFSPQVQHAGKCTIFITNHAHA